MRTGTNLILTSEERNILSRANDILMRFEGTDAGKEVCARNDWVKIKYNKNVFEIACAVLLDTFNEVILEWKEPNK